MEDAADAILQSNDNHPKHSDSSAPGGTQPIVEIALRSLASPFKYPLLLIKFGAVPFFLSVILEIIGNLLHTTGLVRSFGLFWVLLGLTVVYIPFDVGWTRLVIEGAPSVANRSLFPFGRTERYFLLAVFLFGCSWIILAIPVLVARSALRGFNHDLQLAAGLLLLWTFVVIVVCVVRLLPLFA